MKIEPIQCWLEASLNCKNIFFFLKTNEGASSERKCKTDSCLKIQMLSLSQTVIETSFEVDCDLSWLDCHPGNLMILIRKFVRKGRCLIVIKANDWFLSLKHVPLEKR